MTTMQTVLAVIMILASLFLTFTILMQSGSRQGMSGTISGGAGAVRPVRRADDPLPAAVRDARRQNRTRGSFPRGTRTDARPSQMVRGGSSRFPRGMYRNRRCCAPMKPFSLSAEGSPTAKRSRLSSPYTKPHAPACGFLFAGKAPDLPVRQHARQPK